MLVSPVGLRALGGIALILGCLAFGDLTGAEAQEGPASLSPTMAQLIPEDALAVAAWTGPPVAGPNSSRVEAELADGELKEFYQALLAYVRLIAAEGPEEELGDLILAGLNGPGMAYVHSTPVAMRPQMSGGLVLAPGKGADSIERFLGQMTRQLQPLEPVERADAALDAYSIGEGMTLCKGRLDDHFVIAIGFDEGQSLLERVGKDAPEWWHRVLAKTGIPRPLTVVSLSVQRALETVRQSGASLSEFEDMLALTGIEGIQRLTLSAGFDDQGYVHRSWIETDGPRQGLLATMTSGGLKANQLPPIPADATIAMAVDCDLSKTLQILLDQADERKPALAEALRGGIREFKNEFGVGNIDNLSSAIGSPWVVYHSPAEGGWVGGFSAILPITDRDKVIQLEEHFGGMLQAYVERGGFFLEPTYSKSEYKGHTIHSFIDFRDGPLTFAWCLTDDQLVVSAIPSTIRPILDRLADPDSATDNVLDLADDRASFVIAADIPSLQGSLLGVSTFTTRVIEYEFRRDLVWQRGDQPNLPSSITSRIPHGELLRSLAQADRLAVYPEANGVMVEGRFTLPGSELLFIGSTGAGIAMWMDQMGIDPMTLISPMAAHRKRSLNNLKLIALSMHNFHDTYGELPKAASTNEDNEDLLSWRVHLLPYLDQQHLYQQFHLDEPWDSEHNIKLVEQMPDVFRSPKSTAKPGYTTYLTIRSPDSMFPPNVIDGEPRTRGVRFADVRDGLSNTLMVVEANDNSAVIWTKPDDLQPDMALIKQVVGMYRDQFAVVMGDGAATWFPSSIDGETLLKIISRDGGEVVDVWELSGEGMGHDHHDHVHDVIDREQVPQAAPPIDQVEIDR